MKHLLHTKKVFDMTIVRNSILTIITAIIFISCSMLSSKSREYPKWEGWHQTPPEISIKVEVKSTKIISTNDTLHYQIVLTNQTDSLVSIGADRSLGGGFEMDLAVVNKKDEIVWLRFPNDVIYHAKMYGVSLKAGDSFKMEDAWDLKNMHGESISPGTYQLIGGLHIAELYIKEDDKFIKKKEYHPQEVIGSSAYEIEVK